jgi:hypothetical protein
MVGPTSSANSTGSATRPVISSCGCFWGNGGSGKTRLAFELAEQLPREGWQAGQLLELDAPVVFDPNVPRVLLVVDYPEQQPAAVARFLCNLGNAES